jgi:hypothetical protein
MGVYNDQSLTTNSLTGSGAGLKGANCRTETYWGTDLPYTEAQLTALDSTPGNNQAGFPGTGSSAQSDCTAAGVDALTQPFAPLPQYPNTNDQAAPLMSFPIAGSSVALVANLTASDCGGTAPSGISLTGSEVEQIMGGDVLNWNSATLEPGGTNASLASCNVPIVRVVRFDNSGTSSIIQRYLYNIVGGSTVSNDRSTESCDPSLSWTAVYAESSNTVWPGNGAGSAAGSGCSEYINAGTSGGPALVTTLDSTNGGFGYADLADAVTAVSTLTGGKAITATVQNAAGTAAESPKSGNAANCNFGVVSLPGSSPSDAVGLNSGDNWSSDNVATNGGQNHLDVTDLGTQYPICGLTFDLVYTNLGLGAASTPNAISELSADQRRTLYSFMTYVLTTGQNSLPTGFYQSLPAAWQSSELKGFQSNF